MRHPSPDLGNRLLVFSATVMALSFLHPIPLVAAENETMANALLKSGYRSVSLHRQSKGQLSVSVKVNGRPAQLAVDTGAAASAIDRRSAQKFGLREEKSDVKVKSVFGDLNQRLGMAPGNTVELANIAQSDIPFVVYHEPALADSKGRMVGILGLPQLSGLAAVLDCGNARMYLPPNGANRQASAGLGELLARRGFTRIRLQVNSRGHLEAACRLNQHNSVITIETFATSTFITNRTASAAGIASIKTTFVAKAAGGTTSPVKTGRAREFSIGGVPIIIPAMYVTNTGFNVFGINDLARYYAVIDLGARSVYLRPPMPSVGPAP